MQRNSIVQIESSLGSLESAEQHLSDGISHDVVVNVSLPATGAEAAADDADDDDGDYRGPFTREYIPGALPRQWRIRANFERQNALLKGKQEPTGGRRTRHFTLLAEQDNADDPSEPPHDVWWSSIFSILGTVWPEVWFRLLCVVVASCLVLDDCDCCPPLSFSSRASVICSHCRG